MYSIEEKTIVTFLVHLHLSMHNLFYAFKKSDNCWKERK